MLFGNGLSALLTLMGISGSLVVLFVVLPLALTGGARPAGWLPWLVYFGALGAGFMLIEVAILQRFVLLLGHPVYSLTVTLFSLLLGTGLGAALEPAARRSGARARHRDRDRRDRAGGGGLRRRGGSDHLVGRAVLAAGAARHGPVASWCRSACCWACRCRRAFGC